MSTQIDIARTQIQSPQIVNSQVQQTPEQQLAQEIQGILAEMFRISNELAIELATSDCDYAKSGKCPIANAARELVKQLKRLAEIHKRTKT